MKSFAHCSLLTPVLALALALLTGCAATPSQPSSASSIAPPPASSSTVSPPISRAADQRIGFAQYWLSDLGIRDAQHITSVTRRGQMLYTTESPLPLLSAISLENGNIRWRQLVGNMGHVLYPPVIHNHTLFINTESRIYSLNPRNGKIKQFADLPYAANTGATVNHGRAVFGGATGHVFAINLGSFETDWQYLMSAPIAARPATNGIDVVAGDVRGNYILFDGKTGTMSWQRRAFDAINTPPLFLHNLVLVASADQSLYAENLATGRDKWIYRSRHPLNNSPILLGQNLYLPIPGKNLIALNPRNGEQHWALGYGAKPVSLTDGRLLVQTRNQLQLVNPGSGAVIAKAPTRPLRDAIAGPDNSVILVTPRGVLLRLNQAR